jgi:hypothetical protein
MLPKHTKRIDRTSRGIGGFETSQVLTYHQRFLKCCLNLNAIVLFRIAANTRCRVTR